MPLTPEPVWEESDAWNPEHRLGHRTTSLEAEATPDATPLRRSPSSATVRRSAIAAEGPSGHLVTTVSALSPAQLVSFADPTVTVMNNDLQLAGGIAHMSSPEN